jgi:type IV pilus assembly protein PilC
MKSEDLAFVNRQLAAMLQSGVPLEGSLRQLCGEMRRGRLRDELRALEADLARGTSFDDALAARQLPELYSRMLRAGARSQDLPQMLTLLADYYYQQHNLWSRLKGLMIYPAIVLAGCLCLSGLCGLVFSNLVKQDVGDMTAAYRDMLENGSLPALTHFVLSHSMIVSLALWIPALVLAVAFAAVMLVLCVPPIRRWMRFYLPIVRDTAFAQFAATMSLMLHGGCPLRDTVAFLGQVEAGNRLGREMRHWLSRMQDGATRFVDIAGVKGLLPPFFKWLVASAGEDLPGGFQQAADLYQTRALRGRDFILYAALPAATIALGAVITVQVYCLFVTLIGLFLPIVSSMNF